MSRFFRYGLIVTVLIANISCDQISKNLVREKMISHEEIKVVHHYLKLIKVENTGAFLSLGNTMPQPFKSMILAFLPLAFLAIAVVYVFTKQTLSYPRIIAISFVIGGGFGNVYDRLVHGSVTDFLHIDLGIIQTGIFNMADVSIMTGMTMLLIESFIVKNREVLETKSETSANETDVNG